MSNHIDPVFEEGVFGDAVFTGVFTSVIDHLDLRTKRIHLRSGVREYHPVVDIYREVRYIRANDESVRVVDMPVEASGNIPKGGGKFTPRLAIFNHGWRIVPADESHILKVLGEQITDDGQSGTLVMDMSLLSASSKVSVEYAPAEAEIITVSVGGNQYTLDQIAAAVMAQIMAGIVPANVKQMNGATVLGDGTENNKWRGDV